MPGADDTQLPALLVVAAALTREDGRVLVQQRPAHKHHGGLWEFPGGKVELGEAPEAALVRELAEELGVIVSPEHLSPLTFSSEANGGRPLVLLLYRVERWIGEPYPTEAPAIRWVASLDLYGLAMPPADIPLREVLADRAGVKTAP